MSPNARELIDRKIKQSVLDPATGCRVWIGNVHPTGYPWTTVDGRAMSVHRAALIIKTGKDMKGLVSRHSCDNRRCINPDHLSWGTRGDNIRDMHTRNRSRHVTHPGQSRGSGNPNSKLTDEDVMSILRDCSEKKLMYREIAAKYGINVGHVYDIRMGNVWPHIPR